MKTYLRLYAILQALFCLFLLPRMDNLVGDDLFHQSRGDSTPLTTVHLAFLTLLFLIPLFELLILYVIKQFNLKRTERFFWALQVVPILVFTNYLRLVTGASVSVPFFSWVSRQIHSITGFRLFIGLISIFPVIIYFILKDKRERVAKVFQGVGLVCSPIILIVFFSIGYLFLQRSYSFRTSEELKTKTASVKPTKKIVWIIFDEFDQRVFSQQVRRNTQLPELKNLLTSSLYFENAFAPGGCTLHSIPSLLAGERLQSTNRVWKKMGDIKVTNCSVLPNDLNAELQNSFSGEENVWTEFPVIFKELKRLGYHSGLVGWYHSYCNLFMSELDYCRRISGGRFGYHEGYKDNILELLKRSFWFAKPSVEEITIFNIEQSITSSINLLAAPSIEFGFFHLPVPHAPFVFDDKTNSYRKRSGFGLDGYIGNLKLVDNVLGKVRQVLEEKNIWSDTMIIVSSDHHWRESESFLGSPDYRVPYLIKLPKLRGETVKFPVATINTKEFLLTYLQGKITSTKEAISWFKSKNQAFPVGSVTMPFETEVDYYKKLRKQGSPSVLHSSRIESNQTMSKN